MNPIKFAVIGCGSLAQSQHLPNIVASENMILQTCCDLSDEILNLCRERYHPASITHDFQEAIHDPDVDVICLATTEQLRMPVIEAAAEAGKPLFTEKPLASSLEEMRAIQNVVNDSGIPFCVGHNRRCSPAMIDAHRIFREHMDNPQACPWRYDRLGTDRPRLAESGVAAMTARINDDWYSWKDYVFNEDLSYGHMLWEMTHFVDLCNWFMKNEPEEVVALEPSFLNSATVIRYRGGEVATITMACNGSFGYPKELYELFGNGGTVVIDHMVEIRTAGIQDAAPRTTYPLKTNPFPELETLGGFDEWFTKRRRMGERIAAGKEPGEAIVSVDADKGHANMLEEFVKEIRGERNMVCGVNDAVMATSVCFAAIKAAKEKRAVRLEEV